MNSLLFITRVSGDLISWEESVNPLNQWIYRIWEYRPIIVPVLGRRGCGRKPFLLVPGVLPKSLGLE